MSKDLINIKKQMVIKNGNKYGCAGGDSETSTMAKVSIFEVPM